MTTEIDGDVFVHRHELSDTESTIRHLPGGSLQVAGRTETDFTTDLLTYAERIALARFVLKDLAWGPNQTVRSFVAGISGPNLRLDRLAYVNSFGGEEWWSDTKDATDLQTWINHEDSQNLDGVWHERIKRYYADRGY